MPEFEYESLHGENAYLFPVFDLPLADQGLVLVRGLNCDDGGYLGVGKSSLFNGFARIQFGKSGKTDLADDIIFDGAEKDLVQILKFKFGGHPYEIRQYRKHHFYGTKVEFIDRATGEDLLPDSARKHPFVWIRDYLHLDETTFFHLVYLTQDFQNTLLHGKEAERRDKLTSMFDLDIYDLFHSRIKAEMRLLETKLGKVELFESQIEEAKKDLRKIGQVSLIKKRWKRTRKKIEAYQAGWYVSNKELEELQELLAQLRLRYNSQQELDKLWATSPHLRSYFKDIKRLSTKRVQKLQARFEAVTSKLAKRESLAEQSRRRDIIQKHLNSLKESLETIGDDLESAESDLADAKSRIHYLTSVELPASESRESILQKIKQLPPLPKDADRVQADYKVLDDQVSSLEAQIKKVKQQLNSGVCNECKRPLSWSESEYSSKKSKLKQLRTDLREAKNQLYRIKDLAEAVNSHTLLTQKLDALPTTRSTRQINQELGELRATEKKLTGAIELVRQQETLRAQLADLPKVDAAEIEAEVEELTIRQVKYKKALKVAQRAVELQRQIKALPRGSRKELGARVKLLRTDVRGLGIKIKKWSRRASRYETDLERAADLQAKLHDLKKKVKRTKKVKRKLDSYAGLREAFGPNGLKHERFRAILEEATNTTIPTYTNQLWPNKKVQLQLLPDEGLQFFMKRTDKKKLTKSHLLSGGEAHKAGLAFILGLRDLKELYTDCRFNVLIIDEPFGNLDPQGEEALLGVLELLKERFSSIFVISHRPEVINSGVWDKTWWVIREKNASKLWTEPPPAKYQKFARKFFLAEGAQ